jgi:transposase
VIADRGYDSDPLRLRMKQRGTELIAPYRSNVRNRRFEDKRKLRRYRKRWKIERTNAPTHGCKASAASKFDTTATWPSFRASSITPASSSLEAFMQLTLGTFRRTSAIQDHFRGRCFQALEYRRCRLLVRGSGKQKRVSVRIFDHEILGAQGCRFRVGWTVTPAD